MQGFMADYSAKYCAEFECPSATAQSNRGKD
jgi:hypothetical protein